jgi:hypothetical protein
MLLPHQSSAEPVARKIYDWMLQNVEFRGNTYPSDALSTARTGLGSCLQLSRLYVALCRLAGVPARERCGLLIDWHRPGDPELSGESRLLGPPFAHTWAEFFSREKGWIPVEMLPVAHGERVITPWNLTDVGLRQRMCAEQQLYDSYYFGGLDPFRLHGAVGLQQVPLIARRGKNGWEPLPDLSLKIRQVVGVEGRRIP